MEALRVNGDYEIELFHGHPGPRIMNESLEFLAFYLSRSPVLSKKKYDPAYLDHVENVTGHRPELVPDGLFKNWWGPLLDLEHERWMNSKLTSAEFSIRNGMAPDTSVLLGADQIKDVQIKGNFLVKDPYGMSGRGIRTVSKQEELQAQKSFPCILERLLSRQFDFSHYIYPEGHIIAYENLVDSKFQYRGTLFRNRENPVPSEFGFWAKLDGAEREGFIKALETVRGHYSFRPLMTGFSIDSFVYEEDGRLKIHPVCEVNYRRTLGSTAFELSSSYAKGGPWSLFTLARSETFEFSAIKKRLGHLKDVLILSPPDVRYQMFLLSAPTHLDGARLFGELKKLLPEAQFAVNIEN